MNTALNNHEKEIRKTAYIDSHCHLYSTEFEKDIDDVIATAVASGVSKFFCPPLIVALMKAW